MEHEAMAKVINTLISSGMEESEALFLIAALLEQEAPHIMQMLNDDVPNSQFLS